MTGIEGAAQSAPEILSVPDAAAECGASVAEFISWLHDSGVLLVIPGTEDPRCQPEFPGDLLRDISDCGCGFIASPHPDMVELA
jgi:hypothetical protein